MKFMKLGSKSDTFYTAEAVRSISSEVSSDFVIQVKGYRYMLHKFPLLSKSAYLRRLCSEALESAPQPHLLHLYDFPGGPEAFELCAKFCYGIAMTVSARNIVAVRCAAEYLQMTEEAETGNLIQKLDIFFNSCVLNSWRDTIVALQSTEKIPTWSEKLGITSKCTNMILAKILAHPISAKMCHNCPRKVRSSGFSCSTGANENIQNVTRTKAWWFEELSCLSLDLYLRVMTIIKSTRNIPQGLIGEALKAYASKWLPSITKCEPDRNNELRLLKSSKQIMILESIISLLPTEIGSVSCRFLCNLLKAANLLSASSSSKMELAQRIGAQLEEAHISDLIIPSRAQDSNMMYDVDIVVMILDKFMMQSQSPPKSPPTMADKFERRKSKSADNINYELQGSIRRSFSASHSSKLKVAKVVDKYLQEIAKDANLPLSKFVAVAESVPEFARPDHDALYKATDAYLEAHPDLGKSERKRICRVLNCRRLSTEVGMEAARNEKLPLRVVVQLLFLEHSRTATTTSGSQPDHHPDDLKTQNLAAHSEAAEDQWSRTCLKSPKQAHKSNGVKMDDDDIDITGAVEEDEASAADGIKRSCMLKNLCAIPSRPKKMLSRLWPGKVNSRVANERS